MVKSTQNDGEKFKAELADWFDVDYLCDYYMFTEIMGCVDQRVKNMMMGFWYDPEKDKVLAYMIFYDCDTILGVRNDGRLKYSWDVDENTVDPELSTEEKRCMPMLVMIVYCGRIFVNSSRKNCRLRTDVFVNECQTALYLKCSMTSRAQSSVNEYITLML